MSLDPLIAWLPTYKLRIASDFSANAVRLLWSFLFSYAILKYIQARKSPVRILRTAWWSLKIDENLLFQLNAIPTVGYSGVLTSYITAIQYMVRGREIIQEGYDKVSKLFTTVEVNWLLT
jgi:hypothetical protein